MSRIYDRVKKRMKVFALYTLLLTGITVFSLWLADTGMRHAEGFAALREWMYETRYGWDGVCVFTVRSDGWGGGSGMRRGSGQNTGLLFCVWPQSVFCLSCCVNTPFLLSRGVEQS